MTGMRHLTRALTVVAAVLMASGLALAATTSTARALPLSDRSLHISYSDPGATASHTFIFSYTSADPIGSILFEYCTSPLPQLACNAPAGLDASAATLAQQTGETGYSIVSTGTNQITLTRLPAAPAANPSAYSFDNVINPSGPPGPFYVRISTFGSLDATGLPVDFGAVVNATTQGVHISTEVPPILKFCVGLSLADDCTTADESVLDLGELSATRVASGTSQMLAATNAEFGLAIAVYGTTLTSGNNLISALAVPTPSAPGNAQFGLNLRNNSDPDIGQDPAGSGNTTPTGGYNIPNRYTFTNGSNVATSPAATDTRKFTASYIVNIPPSQAPGVYTATLTYICTATF